MTFPALALAMSASLTTYTVVESYPSPLMVALEVDAWPEPAVHRGTISLNDDRRARLLETLATAERAWAAAGPGFKMQQTELRAENRRLSAELRAAVQRLEAHERAAAATTERYETLLRQVIAMAGSERSMPALAPDPAGDPRDRDPPRARKPLLAPEAVALMAKPAPEPGSFEREEPDEPEPDPGLRLGARAQAILAGRGRGLE